MMYKVFKATCENPLKKDFVQTCKKYMEILDIKLTFEEIREMSNMSFKKLVKQKTEEAGLKYLITEKNKQSKIANLEYCKLEMQEYLLSGNRNTKLAKLIFKARGRNLEIKMHKRWRYEDVTCVGCGENIENEEELLSCEGFCDEKNRHSEKVPYSWLYSDSVSKMQKVAQSLQNRLRVRKKILEEPD